MTLSIAFRRFANHLFALWIWLVHIFVSDHTFTVWIWFADNIPTTRSHGQSCAAVRASHKGGLGGGAQADDRGLLGAGKGTGRLCTNKGETNEVVGLAGGGGGAGAFKRKIKAQRPYVRVLLCRWAHDEVMAVQEQRWHWHIVNEVRAGLGGCRVTDKVVFKVNCGLNL